MKDQAKPGLSGMWMRVVHAQICALGLAAILLVAGCQRDYGAVRVEDLPSAGRSPSEASFGAAEGAEELNPRLLRRFAAIHTPPKGQETNLVRLGRILFFEPLLSRTGKISCNSCHPLDRYGATDTKVSVGIDGKLGRRNAPSVYNAAGHFRQFWDGRAASLAEQVAEPLANPSEMGMPPEQLERALREIPGYKPLFADAFPGQVQPITGGNVALAIAEFERGLITPSRWDRYLDGDTHGLTAAEKEGAKLFSNLGCLVCHTGANIGGTMYEKLGIHVPWPNQQDHGRREVTKNPADDMVFKVPSLRNVARTPPYFHDGSIESLDTAVRMMAHHQLGVDLTEEEARSIAAWLGSLTGDIPRQYIAPPVLPASARR
jgi:cytochrome c peroxidase